jgi:branched-subunit amino acid aminotransferase/4-amino-4-deoxychorismate lyase
MHNTSSAAGSNAIRHERSELNGAPVAVDDLRTMALQNYGHFTSMQVSDGGVRGLDLHLQRLESATRELFGSTLDSALVRAHMNRIVAGEGGALSLRVNVFSRTLQRDRMDRPVHPDVLVTVGPPRAARATPLRLKSFRHERTLPAVKHVGTFELFHHRRLAQREAFDDALFVDATGAVSEGSIWNVGFFDGNGIVWPDAPQLQGVSMRLLQNGLRERGIATTTRRIDLADAGAFRSAFFTNSGCPVRAIARIDAMDFKVDADLSGLVQAC